MVVAFYIPHNEGTVFGVITSADFDSGVALVDLYEVDGTIKSFATQHEAERWLAVEHEANLSRLNRVVGGLLAVLSEYED